VLEFAVLVSEGAGATRALDAAAAAVAPWRAPLAAGAAAPLILLSLAAAGGVLVGAIPDAAALTEADFCWVGMREGARWGAIFAPLLLVWALRAAAAGVVVAASAAAAHGGRASEGETERRAAAARRALSRAVVRDAAV
jgi:hypothetical protein